MFKFQKLRKKVCLKTGIYKNYFQFFIKLSKYKNSLLRHLMRKSTSCTQKNSAGRWKKTEHDRFMKALQKYGKNWAQIQRKVPNRTLAQVRSHAQKILQNMPQEERRIIELDQQERKRAFCRDRRQSVRTEEQEKDSPKLKAINEPSQDIKIQEIQSVKQQAQYDQNKEGMHWEKMFPFMAGQQPILNEQFGMQSPTAMQLEHFLYSQYYTQNMNMMPIQVPYFILYPGEEQQQLITQKQ